MCTVHAAMLSRHPLFVVRYEFYGFHLLDKSFDETNENEFVFFSQFIFIVSFVAKRDKWNEDR